MLSSLLGNCITPLNLEKTSHLEKPSQTKGKSYMETLECCFLRRSPGQYFTQSLINHTALKNILECAARRCCERTGTALLRLIGFVSQLWMENSHHSGRCRCCSTGRGKLMANKQKHMGGTKRTQHTVYQCHFTHN